MQTLIVHSRQPGLFRRDLGPSRAFAATTLIGGAIVGCLFWPVFAFLTLWRALTVGDDGALAPAREMTDVFTYILALAGAWTIALPASIAARLRGSRVSLRRFRADAGLLHAGVRRDLGGDGPPRDVAVLLGQDRPRKKPSAADAARRPGATINVELNRHCPSARLTRVARTAANLVLAVD